MKYHLMLIVALLLFTNLSNGEAHSKTLTFVYENYPPYVYRTNSTIEGICIKKIRVFCKRFGYKPHFISAPWSRALNLARNGEVDGILSPIKTEMRKKFLSFSKLSLARTEERLFSVRQKLPPIDTFEKIKKHSIGIVSGYSYGHIFDGIKFPIKITARDNESLILRLNKGWIDTIIMDRNVFNYYIKKLKLKSTHFDMHPLIIGANNLHLAFSKKSKNWRKYTEEFNLEFKRNNKSKRAIK